MDDLSQERAATNMVRFAYRMAIQNLNEVLEAIEDYSEDTTSWRLLRARVTGMRDRVQSAKDAL